MNYSITMYAKLNHKYQSQFNFHFSKCINQIVFNQTIAPSTISFKDAAIYSESIDYLKRQYYIINEIGIQEIFERIGMLAGFYASAVLLRFQYPMMIVTKTKDLFLKRLKRNKKMLTEQGSSDESKSNSVSRSIQLHTNTFLSSVNSSQLSKKTAQLKDELFPQFRQKRNDNKSYDYSIHDIHNPLPSVDNSIVQKQESVLSDQFFADKLLKLSKSISLNEMIDSQAVQLNLTHNQAEVSFLICDFDEIDKEQTIKNYQKLKSRDKQNASQFPHPNQQQYYNAQRFKKKGKMFVAPFDQNFLYSNHEKTVQNPKFRRLPKQMQYSVIEREVKSRPIYGQQTQMHPKMQGFYQTKNWLLLDTEKQKFNQHEQSYKTLERFRMPNGHKANQHQMKYIYNKPQGHGSGRAKANSYQQNYLPRTRSNNVFNIKRQADDLSEYNHVVEKPKVYQPYKQQTETLRRRQKYMQNGNKLNQRYVNGQQMSERYSNKNRKNMMEEMYVTEFSQQQNQRINSPRFANLNDRESQQQKFSIYSKHSSVMQGEGKATYMPLTSDKYYGSGFHENRPSNKYRRRPEQIHSPSYHQQTPASLVHQQNLDDKLQKKKKIRQKAAQLLSRVKSQQYLTARNQLPYSKRY